MTVLEKDIAAKAEAPEAIRVRHFVRGKLVEGDAVHHTSRDLGIDFVTPAIDLDAIIPTRDEMPPLYAVKQSEIIGVSDHLASELPLLIEWVRQGKLDLSRVVTRTVQSLGFWRRNRRATRTTRNRGPSMT